MNIYRTVIVSCVVALAVFTTPGIPPGPVSAQEADRWESPPAETEPGEPGGETEPDDTSGWTAETIQTAVEETTGGEKKAVDMPAETAKDDQAHRMEDSGGGSDPEVDEPELPTGKPDPGGEDSAHDSGEPEPVSPWKRKLTIPDIVIYGKDRTHVPMEQKEFPLQEDPAFPPEMVYRQKTSVPEEMLLEQKQMPVQASAQSRAGAVTGRVMAGYGSFNSLLFSVYHLHGLEILEYELRGDIHSSSGHVDHSEYTIWDVGVGIMPALGRQKARIELGMSRADYAMWGADHPSRQREFEESYISVNMAGDIRHSLLYDLNFSGANLAVESDPESERFDVETVGAALGLMSDWKRLTLHAKGGALREDFRRYWDDYLARWTWEAGADWRLSKRYVLSLGISGISAGRPGGETFEKVYPKLRIAYIPKRGLTLALSYRPSVEFAGFTESFESSRFLDLANDGGRFYPLPLWKSLDAGFEGEYITSHNHNVRFELRFARYRDFPFWTDSDGDSLFDLGLLREVEEIGGSVSSSIPLASGWSILPEITGHWPVSVKDPLYPDAERIPYRSTLEADIVLRYEREEADLRSDVSLGALGSRHIHPDEDTDLDSAYLLDLYAEKGLVPGITIWGLAENLLGADYGLWEGYPMPGISFSIGLKGKW